MQGYALPAGADTVLYVSWLPSGTENAYQAVRRWTHDKYQNQINVGDSVQPGRTLKVTYTTECAIPTAVSRLLCQRAAGVLRGRDQVRCRMEAHLVP